MTEVGSAYVRLRPDFTGFKAETEAGVGSAFSGIGKIVAGAFAAAGAFHLGKEAITGAADLQKQVEAIKEEFGAASASVLDFGKHAAAGLNISEHAADSASAKLGLFLTNLGISGDAAGQMTVQLEKTAGALGEIKNINPSDIIQQFTAGLRGSGRGLAQYGITLNQTNLKLLAVGEGIIKNVKQPLTDAQKAILATQLITSHLPTYLDNAAKHSGDFATQITHLKVQFQNLIEELGTRLLPIATRFVTFLSDNMPAAIALITRAFDAVGQVIHNLLQPFGGFNGLIDKMSHAIQTLYGWAQRIIGPLGGLKTVIESLIAVFAVEKIISFVTAFRDKLGLGTIGAVQQQAQQTASAVETATADIQASSRTAVVALDTLASAATKVLDGIKVAITGVGTAMGALPGEARAAATGVSAVPEAARATAPAEAAGATVAAEAGVGVAVGEAAAGLGIEPVVKGLERVQEEAAKTADTVKEGFAESTISGYGDHLQDLTDRFGEAARKSKELSTTTEVGAAGSARGLATVGNEQDRLNRHWKTAADATEQANIQVKKLAASSTGAVAALDKITVAAHGLEGALAEVGAAGGALFAGLEKEIEEFDLEASSTVVKLKAGIVSVGESVALLGAEFKAAFKQALIFGAIFAIAELYNRSVRVRAAFHEILVVIEDKLLPVFFRLYNALKEPVAQGFRDFVRFIEDTAVPAVTKLEQTFEKLPFDIKAIATAFAGLFLVFGTSATFLPVAGPIIALGALGAAFILAYKHSREFRSVVKEVMGDVLIVLQGAKTAVENFLQGYKDLPRAIQIGIPAVFGLTAAVIALDAALTANPVGVLVLAVAALVLGLIEAYKRFALVREIAHDIGVGFKIVGELAVNMVKTIDAEIQGVIKIITGFKDVFVGIFTLDWRKALHGMGEIFHGEAEILLAVIRGWASQVEIVFQNMWKGIEVAFLKGLQYIANLLGKIPTSINIFGHTFGVKNPFIGFGKDIGNEIDQIENKTKETGSHIVGNIVAPINQAKAQIAAALAKARADRKAALNAGADGRGSDAADAEHRQDEINKQIKSDADAYAKSILDAAGTINKSLTTANDTTNAKVKQYREQLAQLKQELTDAIKQQTDDVKSAVQSAKSNLESIAGTLATDIGTILDKPLQDAQNKITASQNKLTLQTLRGQAVLPGGATLSADPKKALAQLNALANSSNTVARASIQNFIIQYRQALAAVQQDKNNQIKTAAQQRLADLTYAFEHGKISSKQFTAGLVGELKRDHVSFKLAGKELGTAFAGGFRDAFESATKQANALGAAKSAGINIGGSAFTITQPLKTLHDDQEKIHKLQQKIGDTQTKIQTTISANTKKTADMTAQLVALAKANPNLKIAVPGHGAKQVQQANGTTDASGG